MLETLNQWLPLYTAAISTGLLGAIIVFLWYVLKAKDATIETLERQVEYWKDRSVAVVHQMNEALRKEIAELNKKAANESEQYKKTIHELRTTIRELRAKVETPDGHDALDKINNLLTMTYFTPPPSAQAASILEHVIVTPEKAYGVVPTGEELGGADVVISQPDKED